MMAGTCTKKFIIVVVSTKLFLCIGIKNEFINFGLNVISSFQVVRFFGTCYLMKVEIFSCVEFNTEITFLFVFTWY